VSLKDWPFDVSEQLRKFMAELIPFNKALGVEVTVFRDGFARLEIPFRPDLVGDPFRPALHGGVISTLVDTCGGAAAFTLITPPDEKVSTIDMRVDYLRPGELKRIAGEGTVMRMGNRVASVDVRVFHPDAPDVLIATGKAVYSVYRSKAKAAAAG
jgi:uncharacterized protein (TIGR00369 family)